MKFYLSYEAAVDYLAGYRLSSRAEYRDFVSSICVQFPLPYNPDQFYGSKFVCWNEFLSSSLVSQCELKALCLKYNLVTTASYISFVKIYGKRLRMPLHPDHSYPNQGEKFIGFKRLLNKSVRCLSCASFWAKNSGIKTRSEWRELGRSVIPTSIHLNLSSYGSVKFSKFIKGDYYDSNCCTCKGLSYWQGE